VDANQGHAGVSQSPTPLLDDQPSQVDLLNFGHYAAALRDVIVNPDTRTPFIIGILGRWGSGKTTLMRMIERGLEARATIVWFNAWMYTQEKEIWAAFLQSLSARLMERLDLVDKAGFSLRVFRRGVAWDRLLYDGPKYLLRIALVALPIILAGLLAPKAGQVLSNLLNSAGIVGSLLLAFWYAVRPGIDAARRETRQDIALFRPMDFEQHAGSLEKFREQFARILEALPRDTPRLVVFVDDIDRCSPDKALQLLDTIKTFLDLPRCIFVLAVDPSVLQRALETKYPGDMLAQREYLAKIVQLPFHLPPLTSDDLSSYLRLLDVRFPDERCRAVFLSTLAHNPREIKRVINCYSLTWHLARASGALLRPVRLAKVIAIQQGFGTLFGVLREQPEWLGMLERALRVKAGQTTPNPIPVSDVTMMGTTDEIGVPPAISAYIQEPALQRMLTMDPLLPTAEDDANFAHLSAEELANYFMPTRRIDVAPAPIQQSTTEQAGTVFAGRYTLQRIISRGAIGDVFLAIDNVGRRVAVKRLSATLSDDPTWLARFERETQTLARVTAHPNIISLYDSGVSVEDDRRTAYYVMEYVAGQTLDLVLEREHRLSMPQVMSMLVPIFDALAHIHAAGIVHRDVKPSNILIGADGVPKLTDFGLAIESDSGRDALTSVGTVLGTPRFMCPEQILGEPTDARSDLYSFGLVLFQAITGEAALSADSFRDLLARRLNDPPPRPSQAAPNVPATLDPVIARMLARDPDSRYPDAATAKAAFLAAIDDRVAYASSP
jgi:hypothetical protein